MLSCRIKGKFKNYVLDEKKNERNSPNPSYIVILNATYSIIRLLKSIFIYRCIKYNDF